GARLDPTPKELTTRTWWIAAYMIAEIPPSATRAPFGRKPWSPSIPISPAKSCWSPVAHPASGLSVPDAKKPDSRATSARCALLFGLWDCRLGCPELAVAGFSLTSRCTQGAHAGL